MTLYVYCVAFMRKNKLKYIESSCDTRCKFDKFDVT